MRLTPLRAEAARCSALYTGLNTMDKTLARETHPRVLAVRSLTVANVEGMPI